MKHLVGLGTNWQAIIQMKKMFVLVDALDSNAWKSPVITTTSTDEITDPSYLNAVVLIDHTMTIKSMRRWCKEQELQLGRGQLATGGECEADFDLLVSWHEDEPLPKLEQIAETYYRPLVKKLLNCYATAL